MKSLNHSLASFVIAVVMLFQLPPSPVPYTTIPGNPLSIYAAQDGSFQVYSADAGRRQFYFSGAPLADAGFFVLTNGYALGPDFDHHPVTSANTYDTWTGAIQDPITGTGTLADPWIVTTRLSHTSSGLSLTINTSYTNGQQAMILSAEVCAANEISGTLILAGDLSFDDYVVYDLGRGDYDPATGAVQGISTSGGWIQTITPLPDEAVAHFAGPAAELWSALGEAGAPGPGLNNTVSAAPVDLAAGLQWAFSGPGCTTIEASSSFTPNSSQPKPYSIWLPEIFHLQFTH